MINIIGIDKEIDFLKSLDKKDKQGWDIDKYILDVQNFVTQKIGKESSNYLSYKTMTYKHKTILKISIMPNVLDTEEHPFLLSDDKNVEKMYIRRDGQTESFSGTKEIFSQFIKHKKILGLNV